MARIYDEPLNNRSGIGGKEEMQRKESVREMREQEDKERGERIEQVEKERLADVAKAEEEKRELSEQ